MKFWPFSRSSVISKAYGGKDNDSRNTTANLTSRPQRRSTASLAFRSDERVGVPNATATDGDTIGMVATTTAGKTPNSAESQADTLQQQQFQYQMAIQQQQQRRK